MSFVIAAPETMAAAASDLAGIGSALSEARAAAAAARTVAVAPAGADEVSAATAKLFSDYAQDYQSLARQATGFHGQFVQHLKASARSYAGAEAANATSLHASADSSAHSIAASISLPPETPQSGQRPGTRADWVLNQILNVSTRLGELPLPAQLTKGLQLIWLLATLPISVLAAMILLLTLL